jgi:stage III sporulation protein AC
MPLPWHNERDIHYDPVAVEEVYMSVNLIFKIAAVGILVSVLSQVLKHSGREEQAFLTSLAGLLLVLFWIVPYIYELFESIQRLFAL